ncbi:MAG: hypothetical protein CL785_04960 [Chloroflexi bacterium]|nr:hypothetical protein [Chloroflexota bacterium]
MSDNQIAVLIDYENTGLDSIPYLFDQLSDLGRIVVKRAYADWSSAGKNRDRILALGIETIHYFHANRSQKNSSDIHLAIDAVELLYRSSVDTYVVVSADSDFVPLVSKLRASGKSVIGAGRRDVVSSTFVKSCDRYIYLDALTQKNNSSQFKEAENLLVRALQVDSSEKVLGSKLHQRILRLDPSFSFQDYGFQTFAKLLESSKVVKVERNKNQGDVTVSIRENTPRKILSNLLGRSKQENKDDSEEILIPAESKPETTRPRRPYTRRPIQSRKEIEPSLPQTSNSTPTTSNPEPETGWETTVHKSWSRRAKNSGEIINGTWAAGAAARALEVSKLSASKYKTLQQLLDSSSELSENWERDGNTIRRK